MLSKSERWGNGKMTQQLKAVVLPEDPSLFPILDSSQLLGTPAKGVTPSSGLHKQLHAHAPNFKIREKILFNLNFYTDSNSESV